LFIYKIILYRPSDNGGSDDLDNLKLPLCHTCHWQAHGDTWDEINYTTMSEFNDWLQTGPIATTVRLNSII